MSLISGMGSPGRAITLMRAHPRLLGMLMLAPWTVNLVLFLGGWSVLTIWFISRVDVYLAALADAWWTPLLTGFGSFIAVVLAGALAFLATIVGAVIIAAPFHDRLSATAEKVAGLSATPAGQLGIVRSFKEGAKTGLVLLIAEITLLPLYLIPVAGHLAFLMASAFVLTLGLLDVPLARREYTLKQKRGFVTSHMGGLFGLSLGVALVSFAPFINLLMVPVIVVAATLLVAESDARAAPPAKADLPPAT